MTTTELLVQPLECSDSARAHWTIPSGYRVTVHHAAQRSIVVLDGRVYRAATAAVWEATR